jgi:NAD dependent epimerase/dehydratase family
MSIEPPLDSEPALEERLSRPREADVQAAAALEGDLLILGAGGKMGPSLALLARRAAEQARSKNRIIAVARFSSLSSKALLEEAGVETISCDLLASDSLAALPEAPNIVFMAARKFGTTDSEWLTWAMNTYLPARVAERFRRSRIVSFSTGNVYPLRSISQGGAREDSPTGPVGEYAQSALGRERLLQYMSEKWQIPMAILRLNYAIDLRYGVLADVARAVFEKRPVDLRMGLVNVIWQGDANSVCLRALAHCSSPPLLLNVSGPETLSVRYLALEFGRRFNTEPVFSGEESATALLTNAARAHHLFGYPAVSLGQLIDWTAHWIQIGGRSLHKATRYEVRDGSF